MRGLSKVVRRSVRDAPAHPWARGLISTDGREASTRRFLQALSSDWASAPEGIVKLLIKHDRMFSAYLQALRECPSWDTGNVLARVLPGIEKASDQQIDEPRTTTIPRCATALG